MKHFMNWSHWLLLAALCFSTALQAQQPPRPPHPPHPPLHEGLRPDPMQAAFFSPEMVMQHQGELELTEEQRNNIINEMKTAQNNFTDWQWDLKAKMEAMKKLVEIDKVDESKVMEQLEKILALEKKIKTQQLQLMIRVKNQLTAEQIKRLKELKGKRRSKRPTPPTPPTPKKK